jgi:hypothetical protein
MEHELYEVFKFRSPPRIDRGNAPSTNALKMVSNWLKFSEPFSASHRIYSFSGDHKHFGNDLSQT